MPDDIEVNLRDELCENLIWRYDSVDFSYKSPKVSEKALSHNTSRPYSRFSPKARAKILGYDKNNVTAPVWKKRDYSDQRRAITLIS